MPSGRELPPGIRYAARIAGLGAVYNGMTRCSKFTHEGGAEAPRALPEPAEFAADVEELAAYAKMVEDRAKATEARRKLAGLGA